MTEPMYGVWDNDKEYWASTDKKKPFVTHDFWKALDKVSTMKSGEIRVFITRKREGAD